MIRITEFNNPRLAQAFIDYMATQGVTLRLEHQQNYTLLLDDESKTAQVEKALAIFIRDPFHPRYQAASWQSGSTNSGLRYPRVPLVQAIRERAGVLTLGGIAVCLIMFIVIQISGPYQVLHWLSWPADRQQYFQVWRWVSHALLHFSLLHLLFNLLWWWYLGGAIEKRLGSGKLFVIALISALLSGWMQAKFHNIWFGGLSGVVYALMGYCWLRGERDPASGIYLERGLAGFVVLWMILGFFGVFGETVANAVHVTGLAVGLAMAYVDTLQVKRT